MRSSDMRFESTIMALGISLLLACGGGGGGDSSSPQVTEPVSTPEPVAKTEDLVAPSHFGFLTSREVTFNIEAPSIGSNRKFVSIYSRYRILENQQRVPDYDYRLLSLTANELGMDQTLWVTNDINKVMVQVVSDNLDDGMIEEVLNIGSDNQVNWSF